MYMNLLLIVIFLKNNANKAEETTQQSLFVVDSYYITPLFFPTTANVTSSFPAKNFRLAFSVLFSFRLFSSI